MHATAIALPLYTACEGLVKIIEYNTDGNILSLSQPFYHGSQTSSRKHTYDPCWELIVVPSGGI
jgi:hypothetical protein